MSSDSACAIVIIAMAIVGYAIYLFEGWRWSKICDRERNFWVKENRRLIDEILGKDAVIHHLMKERGRG